MKEILSEGDEFKVVKGQYDQCEGCILRVRKNYSRLQDYDVFYSINRYNVSCNIITGRFGFKYCFVQGSAFAFGLTMVKNLKCEVTGKLSICGEI